MQGERGKPEGGEVREILVRAPNWVGDNIFAVPAVQRLKREYPSARISVLAARGPAPLWDLVGEVDEVIPFRLRGGFRDLKGKRELIRRLRERRYDLAVIFPRSFEAALWLRLAGVPRRLGYGSSGRSFLLTDPAGSDSTYRLTPRVDYYYRLLDGGRGERVASPARLTIPSELRGRAREILNRLGIDPEVRPPAGLHPRASYGPAKCWPPERFSRLARLLVERKNAAVLLFGSPAEREPLAEIAAGAGEGVYNLAGETDLQTLAALIGFCRVLVANDSGPLHLAAALGVPVVGLYGSTDPAATGPRGERVRVIYKEAECSPCLKRICPGDFSCMEMIAPEEVLAAAGEIWENPD